MHRFKTDGPNYQTYKDDYRRLFIDVIRSEVEKLSTLPFLISSPSNGKVSLENGGLSEDPLPNSPNYGDSKYNC